MRNVLTIVAVLLFGTLAVAENSVQKDLKRFTGTWDVTSVVINGRKLPPNEVSQNQQVMFDTEGGWQQRSEGQTIFAGTITAIDTAAKHKTIDYKLIQGEPNSGKTIRAIYEFLDDDTYRICYSVPGKDRPSDFSCKEGSGHTVCVLKRRK